MTNFSLSLDRSACAGSFANGSPCPSAGQCGRVARGKANAGELRQGWSLFVADATGQRCLQFEEMEGESAR